MGGQLGAETRRAVIFSKIAENLRCQAVISRGARVTEAHLLGERAVGEAGGERNARHCRNGLNNLSSTIHPRLGKWCPRLSRGFWRANSAPKLAKRRFPTLGKPKITKSRTGERLVDGDSAGIR